MLSLTLNLRYNLIYTHKNKVITKIGIPYPDAFYYYYLTENGLTDYPFPEEKKTSIFDLTGGVKFYF